MSDSINTGCANVILYLFKFPITSELYTRSYVLMHMYPSPKIRTPNSQSLSLGCWLSMVRIGIM
jgi:hypothetical protein